MIPDFCSQIIEVSGPVDEGGDRDHVEPLLARQRHLGLVGDREVRATGGDQLDRRGGVGGGVDADVEPGFLEVAELLRHVDAGVVGVGVEVERQAEGLALGAAVLGLLAAGGEAARARARTASASAGIRRRVIG